MTLVMTFFFFCPFIFKTTNTWEEQRKMDSMRRAYQKAVTIPLNNIEHLWKEYDQWENNLNRLTVSLFRRACNPASVKIDQNCKGQKVPWREILSIYDSTSRPARDEIIFR